MGAQPLPPGDTYQGFQEPQTRGSDLNSIGFVFEQLAGKLWTSIPVKVISINTAGSLSAPGKVDVQPLVHQIDGAGNSVPHGVVYGLPVFRLQSGASAVVMDPTVGDIGLAIFAHRDISAVVASGNANVPGSRRRFDPADGIYLGGILNGAANSYVQFTASGINITDPTQVTVTAPTVNVNASTKAVVTAGECDLISSNVNLGGTGGKKVVLDGDPVIGGGGGTVQASSTKVKAV